MLKLLLPFRWYVGDNLKELRVHSLSADKLFSDQGLDFRISRNGLKTVEQIRISQELL